MDMPSGSIVCVYLPWYFQNAKCFHVHVENRQHNAAGHEILIYCIKRLPAATRPWMWYTILKFDNPKMTLSETFL